MGMLLAKSAFRGIAYFADREHPLRDGEHFWGESA